MNFPPKPKNLFHAKSLQYLNVKRQIKLCTVTLQCTIALFILSAFANLYTYLTKSDSNIVEICKNQVIYGFSLVLFSIFASFVWRYKLRSEISYIILKTTLNFMNIIGSYELYRADSLSDLTPEELLIAQYVIIYPKILPAIFLLIPFISKWWASFTASAVIFSYVTIRVAPSFIVGYSIGMAVYGSLVLLYLFYNIRKNKERKSLKKPTVQEDTSTVTKLQRELLNGLPEGVIILNKQYNPVYINSTMGTVLGTLNDEESVMQRVKELSLETILQEVQKQQESPLYNFNSLTNYSPTKVRTPQGASPDKASLNFSETIKIYMDKSPEERLSKPKVSRIDLTIPSLYLDDLKQKRKVPKKLSQHKESVDEYHQYNKDKESSILLDSSSPRIAGLTHNRISTIKEQYEQQSSYTKIQVEHERFRGHITIPVKVNSFILFNLYGELFSSIEEKNKEGFGHSENIALEIKYQEILMDNQIFIFLVIGDSSRRERLTNLEESTRYKNLMFASISHEFRTPVNSVLGLLQDSLKELDDQKVVATHIKPAADNARLLLFLIDDMLDYSKVLINKLILSLNSFSVKDCVEEITDLFRAEVNQKGLQLRVTILRDVPRKIKADKRRVQQILVNLLSNAVKFTKKGQVEVIVGVAYYSTTCLKITVKDSGIGLKPADTKRLTLSMNDEYINRKIASSSSGVGMGLMMTQSLALALGPPEDVAPDVAGINIDSQYGRGSTFEFVVYNHEVLCTLEEELNTVPTMPEEHSPESKKSTAITALFDPKTNFSRPNFAGSTRLTVSPKRSLAQLGKKSKDNGCSCSEILIVDDSGYNILVLQTLLRSHQIKADTAYDGKEGLEKAIAKSNTQKSCGCKGYKMIFMDYNMPIMDGCTATSELKRLIDSKEIAPSIIVGCTAYDDNAYMDQGLVAGMNEFITKPVNSKVLEDLLKKHDLI